MKNLVLIHGLLALVTLTGCSGADTNDSAPDEPAGSAQQAFATSSGNLGLISYESGSWYFDADRNGSWNQPGDVVQSNFGAAEDIPISGFGPVTCGAGGGKRGTYRPSTGAFFIDMNNNGQWDAGDATYGNFAASFVPANNPSNFTIHPFIYTVQSSGSCKGVLGVTINVGPGGNDVLWIVDLNDNKSYDGGNENLAVFGSNNADDWPVPLYNATLHSSLVTVYRRSTGEWFQDLNNNKAFDGCATDACTQFGSAFDIPFGHPNMIIRGTTHPVAGAPWQRFIDVDGNGWWDSAIDKGFPFRQSIYAQLYL